jgi:hypothetical protein
LTLYATICVHAKRGKSENVNLIDRVVSCDKIGCLRLQSRQQLIQIKVIHD